MDTPEGRILGTYNPGMAQKVSKPISSAHAILPGNVILRAVEGGVEVSAIGPVASMQAIGTGRPASVWAKVLALLGKVVNHV